MSFEEMSLGGYDMEIGTRMKEAFGFVRRIETREDLSEFNSGMAVRILIAEVTNNPELPRLLNLIDRVNRDFHWRVR